MEEVVASRVSNAMSEGIVIRKMVYSDLAPLEWDGVYTHFRKVYQGVYERMQRGNVMAWVAEDPEAGVVGQLFLQFNCDRPELADGWNRAYLYSFRLKPDFRNRGIGTLMMRICEQYLLDRQYSFITLNVARDNDDAIRLYKRHGYRVVAEEPGIWSYEDHLGQWHTVEEPSWRMEKKLNGDKI